MLIISGAEQSNTYARLARQWPVSSTCRSHVTQECLRNSVLAAFGGCYTNNIASAIS